MKKSIGICSIFEFEGEWYLEMSAMIGNYVLLVGSAAPFASKRNALRSVKNFAKKLNVTELSFCDISLGMDAE